jgi:hypothetical protein
MSGETTIVFLSQSVLKRGCNDVLTRLSCETWIEIHSSGVLAANY